MKYSCKKKNCNYSTNNKNDFDEHMHFHVRAEPGIHQCNECLESFYNEDDYTEHMKTHT